MAIEIAEKNALDEVWWIPVAAHPFHAKEHISSSEHRLEMIRLAIEGIPSFKVLEIETERLGPSYTIDTLHLLKNNFPNYEFHLVLGDDALGHFHLWKEPEEIIRLAPPLIGNRVETHFNLPETLPISLQDIMSQGYTQIPLFQISSTAVRQRVKQGLFYGHLVPAKVVDYISQHHLYS